MKIPWKNVVLKLVLKYDYVQSQLAIHIVCVCVYIYSPKAPLGRFHCIGLPSSRALRVPRRSSVMLAWVTSHARSVGRAAPGPRWHGSPATPIWLVRLQTHSLGEFERQGHQLLAGHAADDEDLPR